MELSKDLRFAVQFAGLVADLGVHQRDLADLTALGMRAASAWVRENNFTAPKGVSSDEVRSMRAKLDTRTKTARRRFEDKARKMNLTPIWPTFWPGVKKGKREYALAWPPE